MRKIKLKWMSGSFRIYLPVYKRHSPVLFTGYFQWWNQTTKVNSRLSTIIKLLILIHEFGHGVLYFFHLVKFNPSGKKDLNDIWQILWRPLNPIYRKEIRKKWIPKSL